MKAYIKTVDGDKIQKNNPEKIRKTLKEKEIEVAKIKMNEHAELTLIG